MAEAFAILVLFGIYFIPWWIALLREHNPVGVFIVNLLLGWTLIGWVIALVMSCTAKRVTVSSPPPRSDTPARSDV